MFKNTRLALSATFLLSFYIVANASHKFVGEHADAHAVHHEGGLQAKMTAKRASFNKYEDVKVKDGLFEKEKPGVMKSMYRGLFAYSDK